MQLVDSPLVSVLMPVYNGEKYLKEAIESILNQTYINFEFIIINDGSTDGSEEIILSFSDSRIVYVKNPENYKLIKTLNIGFTIAKGCYIARMDADDISHPDRLQKQVQFLDLNKDYGLIGTGVNLLYREYQSQLLYHTDHESLKFALAFYCPFIHPSVMIRKNIIENMDIVFDERFVHAEDYELWTRLAFKTKMANLPEYLLSYRIHDTQISSQHSVHQIKVAQLIRRNYLSYFLESNIYDFSFVFNLNLRDLSFKQKCEEIKRFYQLDQQNSIFGGQNFNRYLIKLWKNLFLDVKKLHFKDYFCFISSSITWRIDWKIKQLVALFIKTIH